MSQPQNHRKQHYNVSGHAHFITFSCWKRLPLLSTDCYRTNFLESLIIALEKHDFGCWSYVVMPEHVHLVVIPHTQNHSVGSFLSSLKLGVSRVVIDQLRWTQSPLLDQLLDLQPDGTQSFRFWQPGGGVDFNLWTEKKIWQKIDYCHKNPVRRELVSQPEDWEWSSCRDFMANRTVGLVPLDWNTLPKDPRHCN